MNLEALQRYADKVAAKLGVEIPPVLRWSSKSDTLCLLNGRQAAHCHCTPSHTLPRGTICIRQAVQSTTRGWHMLIAHEVVHLATKSSHSSLAFFRKLEKVGQADERGLKALRASRSHHHAWQRLRPWSIEREQRQCTICGAIQEGSIAWGKITPKIVKINSPTFGQGLRGHPA